jgi:hypothetical protein
LVLKMVSKKALLPAELLTYQLAIIRYITSHLKVHNKRFWISTFF